MELPKRPLPLNGYQWRKLLALCPAAAERRHLPGRNLRAHASHDPAKLFARDGKFFRRGFNGLHRRSRVPCENATRLLDIRVAIVGVNECRMNVRAPLPSQVRIFLSFAHFEERSGRAEYAHALFTVLVAADKLIGINGPAMNAEKREHPGKV